MISRLLGGLRKRPNASRVSKHRMARFIPNAEIHEPHDEWAICYLAVETRRDMRSITIASNVSGLESSGESFPAKQRLAGGNPPSGPGWFHEIKLDGFPADGPARRRRRAAAHAQRPRLVPLPTTTGFAIELAKVSQGYWRDFHAERPE